MMVLECDLLGRKMLVGILDGYARKRGIGDDVVLPVEIGDGIVP
jgi:hypothetical protein